MDWGMSNRLSRIIKPSSGKSVMLAVDHGYFMGPTHKLEQPRKTIEPLVPYADALMLTRGVLRTSVDPKRDARYLALSCRIAAELGARLVKTYFCEEFSRVVQGCPVPLVVAGGPKLEAELDAFQLAYDSIAEGAVGVDMGRNIWQSEHPVAMIQAVSEIVHERATVREAKQAYDEYLKTGPKLLAKP